MAERRQLTVNISAEAAEGWRDAAVRLGCTMTALLEVVGRTLGSREWAELDTGRPEITALREQLQEAARAVDAERRRRR